MQVQSLALAPQQRGVAEKAVAQEFNWDDIGAMVHSDEGRRELQALRSTYLDIQARLTNMARVRRRWAVQCGGGDPRRGRALRVGEGGCRAASCLGVEPPALAG